MTYPDSDSGIKFQKPTQLEEESKLIRVTVNPETRLLEIDNYEMIADMSGCTDELFSENEIGGKVPHLELRYGYS